MPKTKTSFPKWLTRWMQTQKIPLWGAADLTGFETPCDAEGQGYPSAIAWAYPMPPQVMAGIQKGPNQAYAETYTRINARINRTAVALAAEIRQRGMRATPLAASERTDQRNIKGDFPHKTAATRAGLGWIGRHCQLVTWKFGPWVRLGTVFTDMPLSCGPAVERSFCGRCDQCVGACPAGALSGREWWPGLERAVILDAKACDKWKKDHFYAFNNGRNCGICAAVCPFGAKTLKTV